MTQVHADGPTVGHTYTPIGYDEKGNVYNVNGPNFFDGTTPVSGYHSTGVNNGDFVLYFANPLTGQVLSYDPDNWSLNPLGTRWMLSDANGSTRAVVTGASGGTIADRITYSSFGTITSETASPGLDQPTFTYEGMVDPRQGWNAASGLLLDHARLYDPNTSRFLTPDPSPATNNDQFNLYRYAWNDPINMADPTGTSATRNYFGSADYNLSLSGYSTRGSSVSTTSSYNFTSSTSSFSSSLTPYYSYSAPVSTPIPTSYAGIGPGAVFPGTISTLSQPAASFNSPSLNVFNQSSDLTRLSSLITPAMRASTPTPKLTSTPTATANVIMEQMSAIPMPNAYQDQINNQLTSLIMKYPDTDHMSESDYARYNQLLADQRGQAGQLLWAVTQNAAFNIAAGIVAVNSSLPAINIQTIEDGQGWRVGDPINNMTASGNVPAWNTVRARYWKNEALNNATNYDPSNLARMKQGLAPQRINSETGQIESMELHHNPPQRQGGLFDVQPVWPSEHANIDPYRITGG